MRGDREEGDGGRGLGGWEEEDRKEEGDTRNLTRASPRPPSL